jgi:hypothetical protein
MVLLPKTKSTTGTNVRRSYTKPVRNHHTQPPENCFLKCSLDCAACQAFFVRNNTLRRLASSLQVVGIVLSARQAKGRRPERY